MFGLADIDYEVVATGVLTNHLSAVDFIGWFHKEDAAMLGVCESIASDRSTFQGDERAPIPCFNAAGEGFVAVEERMEDTSTPCGSEERLAETQRPRVGM